jgi:ribokinase
MKVFNYGSINIDHIYRVGDFVRPGETLASDNYRMMLGGKGANQSIALVKAGVQVQHIGRISDSDEWICQKFQGYGIGAYCLQLVDEPTGHAIIQVSDAGENSILLHGGANQSNSLGNLAEYISNGESGDWLLLQNECNLTADALTLAKNQDMTVAFNPAPMSDEVREMPLDCVDYLIVNEIEAADLLNQADISLDQPEILLEQLHNRYPTLKLVLTLGEKGVMYKDTEQTLAVAAKKVDPVDTTAAGDTFIGYFIQQAMNGASIKEALDVASKASAITVQTLGASESIPDMQTVVSFDFK